MADSSIPDFLNALAASQLLTEGQLSTLRKQLVGNPITAEGLAKTLVNQKVLTSWQAQQLFRGQTGFVLQQYRLLNPIGRGGMGHVFRARAAHIAQDVAVKVMARKLKANETLVSRFRREIRASSKLDSPHIVKTMDAGRVGSVDFMVMEYVNGDQIDRIANRLGRVPEGLSCDIVRQAAIGLQHAHERQMVHRDIKPANIMVHWDDSGLGIVKLMDMGLVLLMSDDVEEKNVTRAGQVMGTPDYMSPEQGWDTTNVDIRSDIYSLGCTLFRLLTGTIPFTGSNPLQVLSQRLQRDAPSVLTVCDDISADVAAVVSKMTTRDPEARYQTPQEVVAALTPFCEALTLERLRTAQQTTNAQEADDATDDDSNEAADEFDGSYQQFLKEVEEGSFVDLMLTTDADASPLVATVPAINLNVNVTPNTRGSNRGAGQPRPKQRPKPNREQKTGWRVFGIAILGVLGLIGLAIMALSGNAPDKNPVVIAPAVIAPVAAFEESKVIAARVGKTWKHQVVADITTPPSHGKLEFVVDSTAPADLNINPTTGEISWPVPLAQPAADYAIAVQLVHVVNDVRQTIATTRVSVTVKPDMTAVVLPAPRRNLLLADVGQPFSLSMAVDNGSAAMKLSYQFASPVPDGLQIDAETGQLSWLPIAAQLGRHDVTVSVSSANASRELDSQQFFLLVTPTELAHVLPALAPQAATAGQPFRFELPTVAQLAMNQNPRLPMDRIIEADQGAPAGLTISPPGEIRWDVPADVSGPVQIALRGRMEGPGISRTLNGTVMLQLNVAAKAGTTPAAMNSVPDETQIKQALEELRNTYRSSIVQARTAADKTRLAHRLLMIAASVQPNVQPNAANTASATDAALLQLIEEDLARKARATDVLLDVVKLRAERYGVSELPAAAAVIESFRKSGLTQMQQDLIVEHGLRLAGASNADENYALTAEFLDVVKALLNRSATGASALLYADVDAAANVASELSKAAESGAAVDQLKAGELSRLINRWQFKAVFGKSSNNVFIEASATQAVPGNGRELWNVVDDRIELKSATQGFLVGFLDSSQQLDRYVVRFQLLPESNCTQLVFAANGAGTDDFSAHVVVLNTSALGQINNLRNNVPLNASETSSQVPLSNDIPNLVEVVVDGPQVAVRLNGSLLSTANIAGLEKGWLGIIADLRRPEPQLLIRQPRILVLP